MLEGVAMVEVGRVTVQQVEWPAEFSTHNPWLVGETFSTHLRLAWSCSTEVNQLNAVGVDPPIEGFTMNIEQTEPAASVEPIWKPVVVTFNNPTVEEVIADAFAGEQWCKSYHFRRI